MKKIVRPGTAKTWGGRSASVYCKIEYTDGNLSIHGVVGPLPSGNCLGSCGQIDMGFKGADRPLVNYALGWDFATWDKFLNLWERWHLNDMKAGCEHQRAEGWGDVRIPRDELPRSHANSDERGIIATWVTPDEHPAGLLTKPCPVCGYKYGTAWLKEEVPQDVIDFLFSLPDTDKQPAWV